MKRSLIPVVVVGLAVGLTLGVGSPASALTFWFGSTPCTTVEQPTAYTAKSSKGGCSSVRSRVTFIDAGGTSRTVYGAWAATSTATATTTMITGRAVNARLASTDYGFVSY